MSDLSDQTCCFFCHRVLNTGEGRYRLFQNENEMDCCPSCFDTTRAHSGDTFTGQALERTSCEAETEFK